jgi:hypothetical protein
MLNAMTTLADIKKRPNSRANSPEKRSFEHALETKTSKFAAGTSHYSAPSAARVVNTLARARQSVSKSKTFVNREITPIEIVLLRSPFAKKLATTKSTQQIMDELALTGV